MNILTCQGIGDIFWAYQKLSPITKKINIKVAITNKNKVQLRSLPWLSLLPKVGNVSAKLVTQEEYNALAGLKSKTPKGFTYRYIPFSVNAWLEQGTRIENIDSSPIEWNVPVRYRDIFNNIEYITLYVSGTKGGWSNEQWVDLVKLNNPEKLPIVLIGASYDRHRMAQLQELLHGFTVIKLVNHPPLDIAGVIKNTKLFIGYQSGLNVIADNFNISQIMIYYKHLEPMMFTWPKPENIVSGVYKAFTF